MSQMHKIKTLVHTSDSNSSQKLINGFWPSNKNESVAKQQTINATTTATPTTAITTKNDRNNNNVMKKSMPPPIPPKKSTKINAKELNNVPAQDSSFDNNEIVASHDIAINHVDDQHALTKKLAASNELHKLSNSSPRTIDEKGHNVATAERASDTSNAAVGNNNNNETLNDDIVASTKPRIQFKSRFTSGTSKRCDNEMGKWQSLNILK